MNKVKKIISTAIAVSVLLSCISVGTATANSLTDINKDGTFDVKDVTYMQQCLAGGVVDENVADTNSDGLIDVKDVTYLQIELTKSEVVEMSIDNTNLSLGVGDTYTLKINTNSTYKTEWKSSDNDVVKIISSDTDGAELRATKVGTATVTVKQKDKTATCKINVSRSKCIDVSVWQGDIDFNKVKASGIDYVIIRAGYGRELDQKDEMFEENYRKAKAAGMKIGVYWYSYATDEDGARKEAQTCLTCIGDKELDLPVFLDCEEYRQAVLTETLTDIVNTFCQNIENNSDYKAGVYGAYSMLTYSMDIEKLDGKYCIWLGDLDKDEKNLEAWADVHQYSWTGKIDGISGNVDLDYIYDLSQ